MNTSTSNSNHHFRSVALVALCLLCTSTAWAGPPVTRSVAVSFHDLDLSTKSGVAKLYHRIQAAAQIVCRYEATLVAEQQIWKNCVRPAVDAAVATVNNPLLTAYHTGRSSPAATAMINK